MKILLLAPFLMLVGCATEVFHESKTQEETQRDIKVCTDHGKLASPYEPIAALNIAYECLEKKGYRRGSAEK